MDPWPTWGVGAPGPFHPAAAPPALGATARPGFGASPGGQLLARPGALGRQLVLSPQQHLQQLQQQHHHHQQQQQLMTMMLLDPLLWSWALGANGVGVPDQSRLQQQANVGGGLVPGLAPPLLDQAAGTDALMRALAVPAIIPFQCPSPDPSPRVHEPVPARPSRADGVPQTMPRGPLSSTLSSALLAVSPVSQQPSPRSTRTPSSAPHQVEQADGHGERDGAQRNTHHKPSPQPPQKPPPPPQQQKQRPLKRPPCSAPPAIVAETPAKRRRTSTTSGDAPKRCEPASETGRGLSDQAGAKDQQSRRSWRAQHRNSAATQQERAAPTGEKKTTHPVPKRRRVPAEREAPAAAADTPADAGKSEMTSPASVPVPAGPAESGEMSGAGIQGKGSAPGRCSAVPGDGAADAPVEGVDVVKEPPNGALFVGPAFERAQEKDDKEGCASPSASASADGTEALLALFAGSGTEMGGRYPARERHTRSFFDPAAQDALDRMRMSQTRGTRLARLVVVGPPANSCVLKGSKVRVSWTWPEDRQPGETSVVYVAVTCVRKKQEWIYLVDKAVPAARGVLVFSLPEGVAEGMHRVEVGCLAPEAVGLSEEFRVRVPLLLGGSGVNGQEDRDGVADFGLPAAEASFAAENESAPGPSDVEEDDEDEDEDDEGDEDSLNPGPSGRAAPHAADAGGVVRVPEPDNGVFCPPCGAYGNVDTGRATFYVQCESCQSWQHGSCVGFEAEEDVPEKYVCTMCDPAHTPEPDEVRRVACMMTACCSYVRGSAARIASAASVSGGDIDEDDDRPREATGSSGYEPLLTPSDVLLDTKQWDETELRRLCIERGLPYDPDPAVLRSVLAEATVFARTPRAVGRLISRLAGPAAPMVDLMAGNGNISRFLPAGTLCVEKVQCRADAGKSRVPSAKWLQADIFSPDFLKEYVCHPGPEGRGYHRVVSNPAFELAVPTLYIASLILEPKDGRAIFLLPSDFFEGSTRRSRLYRLLRLEIEVEYRVGRWCYYPELGHGANKQTCDSVFVLKVSGPDRSRKFEHRTVQSRVQGLQTVI